MRQAEEKKTGSISFREIPSQLPSRRWRLPFVLFGLSSSILASSRSCSDDNGKEARNNRGNSNNKHNGSGKRGPRTIIAENKKKGARISEAWEAVKPPALMGLQ